MQIDLNLIPQYIKETAKKLQNKGFKVYLVGGPVRDILMGKKPKDYDLTTNAKPAQIAEVFPQSVLTGMHFGTVKAYAVKEDGERDLIDITTFRSEEDYINGRWPTKVEFTSKIEDDLKRRDFTINAMAIDLASDQGELIDLFEGQKDIRSQIIRAVGNPIERFQEDGLRAFRACRFASTLGFSIEENTFNAIKQSLDIAALVSKERIRIEFVRLLEESPKPSVGLELMRESGLMQLFIPELLEGYGMKQNEFHTHDVYYHELASADVALPRMRLAALLHDIGKPRTKSGKHFYGHDKVGAKMAKEILLRLKFSNSEIEQIAKLIRHHMFFYPENKDDFAQRLSYENDESYDKDLIEHNRKAKRDGAFENGWSDNAIRRFLFDIGGFENIDDLIELRIADATSNPKSNFDPDEIRSLQIRVSEILAQENALKVSDLKINGNDLFELGIEAGPKMKEILDELLQKVLDEPELNNKETLIKIVRSQFLS